MKEGKPAKGAQLTKLKHNLIAARVAAVACCDLARQADCGAIAEQASVIAEQLYDRLKNLTNQSSRIQKA